MRIAVTGKQGQVAQSLAEIGTDQGVEIILVGRPELDLLDASTVYDAIARVKPDIIVSAAAYTAVDKAESEREAAFAVNATGAEAVAQAAAKLDTPVIHLSTDYVFDGSLDRPYREDDMVGPASVYGASKLEGERLVAAATPDHVIFRTAWVYSPFGNNFVKTMLRLGETRAELNVVADQVGCPTSALDIARAVITAAGRLATDPSLSLRGIFHLTGSGQASWADFAEHIFISAEAGGRAPVKVNRITTADYPTPARRPANSRLSGDKLQQHHGIRLPDWRESADRVVGRLLSNI
ncbi:MAG: rfbD [Rhizobium sp.]|nr:rfbD [Rhizobium sp.]